mgnify:CR=1 FL=1
MRYRKLGRTDLEVSEITLGTWLSYGEGDVRAQVVMDNLIYRREIPVMIGVFINPGRTPEQPEPTPRGTSLM